MTATNSPVKRPKPSRTSAVRTLFARICCWRVTSERYRDRIAFAVVFDPEVLARCETERARDQARRERLLGGVERLHDGVVVAPGGGDLVLGVGQLVLQAFEVLA